MVRTYRPAVSGSAPPFRSTRRGDACRGTFMSRVAKTLGVSEDGYGAPSYALGFDSVAAEGADHQTQLCQMNSHSQIDSVPGTSTTISASARSLPFSASARARSSLQCAALRCDPTASDATRLTE